MDILDMAGEFAGLSQPKQLMKEANSGLSKYFPVEKKNGALVPPPKEAKILGGNGVETFAKKLQKACEKHLDSPIIIEFEDYRPHSMMVEPRYNVKYDRGTRLDMGSGTGSYPRRLKNDLSWLVISIPNDNPELVGVELSDKVKRHNTNQSIPNDRTLVDRVASILIHLLNGN